jgi:3-oxoacyl-[acyl-carrier protein] reductase
MATPAADRKVVLVTGSSSGIGADVARCAAAAGCNVVINYHSNAAGAAAVAADCEQAGVEAVVVGADVADDADCRRLVAAAAGQWGRLDALVNNAGTTLFCAHDDLDGLQAEDFQRLYATNTIGAFQMARAAAPLLRAARGSIVNVASIAGVLGVGSSLAYACSKAAMLALNKSLARSLGPEVRVNAVCPGMVEGDWLQQGLGEELYTLVGDHYRNLAPTGAVMTTAEVAQTIWFFAHSAPNVTGEQLILDGGANLAY